MPFGFLSVLQSITWIKVDKPRFDLVGVVLSSLGAAGICAAVAMCLGVVLGVVFIVRSRRRADQPGTGDGTLQLLLAGPGNAEPAAR